MKEKVIKGVFYSFLFAFVATLAFFIVYNAQWLLGDDSIIICKTGWGHFFSPSNQVQITNGRFFPLAYFSLNCLYVLGLSSCAAHFVFFAVLFCLLAIFAFFVTCHSIGDTTDSSWKYLTFLSVVAIIIQRFYPNYLDAFSTAWFSAPCITAWCLCCYYTHNKQSKTAAIMGFIIVSYLCYCSEVLFVFPLSYGVCGILFGWNHTTRLEKAYLWSLVGTALLFLITYYFVCYIHIEQDYLYDGAHGQNIGLFENAIKMFIAQKVLWFGIIVLAWRIYCIFHKKEEYEFWDTMILSGFAFCCAGAILRLNWCLYYSQATIFMLPAIVHYINKYLGAKWCALIVCALAIFMCRNIPDKILENQAARKSSTVMINTIYSLYDKDHTFYWFEPSDNRKWNFDIEMRCWWKESLQTYIGYSVKEEHFKFETIKNINLKPGLYFLPKMNNALFPNINDSIASNGIIVIGDNNSDFQAVLIE